MAARLILSLAVLAAAAPPPAFGRGAALPPFLELRIPKSPTVATGDGGSFLAYEMHVTSFAQQTMTLKRVEVAAAGWSGTGTNTPLAERARLAGGTRAVVWFWVPVDRQAPPASVQTRVTLEQGTGDSVTTQELDGAAVSVAREGLPMANMLVRFPQ